MKTNLKTTKERLLALIDACIEDRNFYSIESAGKLLQSNPWDIPSHVFNGIKIRQENFRKEKAVIRPKGIYLDGMHNFFTTVRNIGPTREEYFKDSSTYYNRFCNLFGQSDEELAKIHADLAKFQKQVSIGFFTIQFDESPIIEIKLQTTEDFKDIETIKFQGKDSLITERNYENKVYIVSGLLSAEISIEECNALYNRIAANYKKFLFEIDEAILTERLQSVFMNKQMKKIQKSLSGKKASSKTNGNKSE